VSQEFTETVLIVDDVEANRFSLSTTLESPNRQILTASSGEEALSLLLKNHDVTIILMDLQMPGMDGFETAQFIKQNPKHSDIPIIFITAAYKNDSFMNQGFNLGASDYIVKPVDPDLLRHKVSMFIHHYKQQQSN